MISILNKRNFHKLIKKLLIYMFLLINNFYLRFIILVYDLSSKEHNGCVQMKAFLYQLH